MELVYGELDVNLYPAEAYNLVYIVAQALERAASSSQTDPDVSSVHPLFPLDKFALVLRPLNGSLCGAQRGTDTVLTVL